MIWQALFGIVPVDTRTGYDRDNYDGLEKDAWGISGLRGLVGYLPQSPFVKSIPVSYISVRTKIFIQMKFDLSCVNVVEYNQQLWGCTFGSLVTAETNQRGI